MQRLLNSVVVLSTCLIAAMSVSGQPQSQTQTAKASVTAKGFEPSTISLRLNVPADQSDSIHRRDSGLVLSR